MPQNLTVGRNCHRRQQRSRLNQRRVSNATSFTTANVQRSRLLRLLVALSRGRDEHLAAADSKRVKVRDTRNATQEIGARLNVLARRRHPRNTERIGRCQALKLRRIARRRVTRAPMHESLKPLERTHVTLDARARVEVRATHKRNSKKKTKKGADSVYPNE